jgi:methylenetetrahydrofolate reductase (NADPH)
VFALRPIVHPNWLKAPNGITDGYSLEVTAKDIPALTEAAPHIWDDAPVAVPYLPGESNDARISAAIAIRELGFEPMPHFSARRITSKEEFESFLLGAVEAADVKRCFIVAGDPSAPLGPFSDSSSLIETGAFERAGIKVIGVGGHPEGHPVMSKEQCWTILETKCADIEKRGIAPLIVTQFSFDADAILAWLKELRSRGMDYPVRIGVPGPAGIKTLTRYAALCGVQASASVFAKYGVSLGRLIGSAGPDRFVERLAAGLGQEHGPVRLHFYPFGGVAKTLEWISNYERTHPRAKQ